MTDSTIIKYNVPSWYDELAKNYQAALHHQFLFDGNIEDNVFLPDNYDVFTNEANDDPIGDVSLKFPKLITVKGFFIRALLKSFDMVFYYSSTQGMKIFSKEPAINPSTKEKKWKINQLYPSKGKDDKNDETSYSLDQYKPQAGEVTTPKLPDTIIPTQTDLIYNRNMQMLLYIEKMLKNNWTKNVNGETQEGKIAVIIDHLENIIPSTSGGMDRVSCHFAEMIQFWGQDKIIKRAKNISILIAENRECLPKVLQTDEKMTLPIRIPFPNTEYRSTYFQSLQPSIIKPEEKDLLQLTRGFRIADCDKIRIIQNASNVNINKYFFGSVDINKEQITSFLLKEKKDVIAANSKGMLQPLESNITFKDIGGLDGLKEYFKRVSEAIKKKDDDPSVKEIIPKGVLMAGPPGTGKTLLAKALATESGISLVKMGDIRSMWVGESERNLSMVLSLLKEMAPVIVFIDEIDQALGSRSTSSGDSGVGGRMFGKILEFMGDNANRGDVIWIAATNRADLLDDAMIRRFDRIVPVLLPGSPEEWSAVIKGIANQIKYESLSENEGIINKFVNDHIATLRKNHSGSSMEVILRAAYQNNIGKSDKSTQGDVLNKAFDNFKTNFNQDIYQFQTLLAIAACNQISFITEPSTAYSYGADDINKAIEKAMKDKSNMPLQAMINDLRGKTIR